LNLVKAAGIALYCSQVHSCGAAHLSTEFNVVVGRSASVLRTSNSYGFDLFRSFSKTAETHHSLDVIELLREETIEDVKRVDIASSLGSQRLGPRSFSHRRHQ